MASRDSEAARDAATIQFSTREDARARGASNRNLESLLDVPIAVTVEVGGAELTLQEVLDLVPGTVVSLDKRVDVPLDLRVNGKLVARGEIVSVDGSYALRVTEIVDAQARLESLR